MIPGINLQYTYVLHFDLHAKPRSLLFFVIDSVCPSICHAGPSKWSFFVSRWNRAIFGLSSLHVALYKMLFFDFRFRSPNAQNLLPKIAWDNDTLQCRHPWSRSQSRSQHSSSAWGKSPIHWTSGPNLVAMAMKSGLGAEIQSPTGLSYIITNTVMFTDDSRSCHCSKWKKATTVAEILIKITKIAF